MRDLWDYALGWARAHRRWAVCGGAAAAAFVGGSRVAGAVVAFGVTAIAQVVLSDDV